MFLGLAPQGDACASRSPNMPLTKTDHRTRVIAQISESIPRLSAEFLIAVLLRKNASGLAQHSLCWLRGFEWGWSIRGYFGRHLRHWYVLECYPRFYPGNLIGT